ncbi:hypothetical protein K1719_000973 [Acacia pycnantha]|nr:hypothetical protein K1719_000973 [Acacia pycnantha]
MEIDQPKLQRLRCSVKNFDWGQPARDSKVAQLSFLNSISGTPARGSRANFDHEPDNPYAELWIGTNDSGPSFLFTGGDENESLKSFLSRNPHFLGPKILRKWGADLPFLIKVVSVAKASPVQVHHHKSGMVLAISGFEALCGFISFEELQVLLKKLPEVWSLVKLGDSIAALDHPEVNEQLFFQIMSADQEKVTKAISKMKSRLYEERQGRGLTDKEELALRLDEQHPNDVRIIASFFLNYVKLKPDEAISIGPNEQHVYISGDCIECKMKRDTQLWQGSTEIMPGNVVLPFATEYLPPFYECEIRRFVIPQEVESLVIPAAPTPSIFLVTDGAAIIDVGGTEMYYGVGEGDVLFAPANTRVPICQLSSLLTNTQRRIGQSPALTMYRVGVKEFLHY